MRGAASIIVCVILGGCADIGATADSTGAETGAMTPRLGAAATTMSPAPGAIVDSARPMATLIARFQSGLPRPHGLSKGASSRDALVRSFLAALARRDTAAIADLFVSRAEFAYLYFPSSALARPPYELDPALAWFQLSAESERGVRTALALGGRRVAYEGHSCTPDGPAVGSLQIWRDCTLRLREPDGAVVEGSVFAAIIEHNGRFKFFSYATTL